MCDGASIDYSVAGLLDTPQFTLLLHKCGFGKEMFHVRVHRWKWLNYSEDKNA